MADIAVRRPIELPAATWLQAHEPLSRFIFRGNADARGAAGQAFGIAFAEDPCRASTDGTRAALWLGPDEHLLLAPAGDGEAVDAAFAEMLTGHAYSLVDVSHRQVALDVRGPQAEWLLESQCPLPLSLRDFPVGKCTRTIFGKAEIVLWRPAETVFRLEVWRSFSLYVAQMLHEVARELPA